ncbi:putative late L2 protein [Eptesicus serotinus papillomavirus 1]|uniref:Minor capsid protein L2 n=1 Tax=Eptesicus serotinus papillomavirus 1 TaxID=1464071 RepID=W8EH50_9PAPI|nr:putative late L2 protein [Eptesicus serotinus papillomavirus 1]AHJ81388.1 putative late L2 protein [Eptesicus serotinus papillomavirus 1]
MVVVLRRRKRDTVENIYRQCIRFGTCPPDVKNKVENNTLADKILRYGSGAVYFGGLGIGTGTGRGTTGVSVGRQVPVRPFRPHGPIDTIGIENIGPRETPFAPPERAPVDVDLGTGHVEPSDPSVIEPTDLPIDIPTSSVDEVIVIPTPEITIGGDTTAIIEVTPSVPENTVISRTQYTNPAFDISLFSDSTSGELSASDHITVSGGGGTIVGGHYPLAVPEGEEIPLAEFSPSVSRFRPGQVTEQEETSFITSTPEGARARPGRTRPSLYGRRIEQVEITDPLFIDEPGRLVEFNYVNPAFEGDITEIFEQDILDEARAAPSSAFQDIVRLGRQQLSRSRSGLVRVSRLGQRGTIRTRSGVRIGSTTHFYMDLSPIGADTGIPIEPPGEQSLEASIVQPFSEEGYELVNLNDVSGVVPDESLLDSYEETEFIGSDLQLVIHDEDIGIDQDSDTVIDIPSGLVKKAGPYYPDIDFAGVNIDYDKSHTGRAGDIVPSDTPIVTLDIWSSDFYLHPSLRRKRRRRRKYVFVY